MRTSAGYDIEDPEVQALLETMREQLKKNESLTAREYDAMAKADSALPPLRRVYRFFGQWDEMLGHAKPSPMQMPGPRQQPRFTDEQLIVAVKYVAQQLGTNVLSSPAYESFTSRKAPHLPSASAVRKRLGDWKWSVAMARCGLQAPDRSSTKPLEPAQIVRALQLASRGRSPVEPLTQLDYNAFCNAHEDDDLPELMQILEVYGTWEQALHAAHIELEDDMHYSGWTIHEARMALQLVQRFTNQPVTRKTYERTRAKAKRMMPMWNDVLDILNLHEDKTGRVTARNVV